ncbi:hypothetical protein COV94_01170, partial [Candidatus Woesearchaeota archaeon CG11_big_fil_rev_8_21_14_0_20_57_5]
MVPLDRRRISTGALGLLLLSGTLASIALVSLVFFISLPQAVADTTGCCTASGVCGVMTATACCGPSGSTFYNDCIANSFQAGETSCNNQCDYG